MSDPANTISFQGMRGAYSMAACRSAYPDMDPMPCRTFVDAFEAVETGRAALASEPSIGRQYDADEYEGVGGATRRLLAPPIGASWADPASEEAQRERERGRARL